MDDNGILVGRILPMITGYADPFDTKKYKMPTNMSSGLVARGKLPAFDKRITVSHHGYSDIYLGAAEGI